MRSIKFWLMSFGLFFTAVSNAYVTAGDVYTQGDTNWQQSMLKQFYDPQSQMTNFSFPPGIYRAVCTGCEYDLTTVSCNCQDVAGLVSYFPTRLKVDNCKTIYDDRSGMLQCAD